MNRSRHIVSILALLLPLLPVAAWGKSEKPVLLRDPEIGQVYTLADLGGDTIQYGVTAGGPATELTFCLSVGPDITWWKGLKVYSDQKLSGTDKYWSGLVRIMVETQGDSRGPVCGSYEVDKLKKNRIELHKAMLFGVHDIREHYRIDFASTRFDWKGKTISFIWMKD